MQLVIAGRIVGTVLLFLILGSVTCLAQRAQITGRITDSTGAVVVGTDLSLTNVDTGVASSAASNEAGYYTIPLLPPGRYQMVVKKEGFKPMNRSGITLEINQVARVDFVLEGSRANHASGLPKKGWRPVDDR